ncbi:hypothetical protein MMC14_005026 [Varicellaria rhodocarpa]|nr:hypothetical protein [Varicellaria rhodocarpa]
MTMVQYFIPPPNPRELLPSFLACLPTAFASPQPPPALLPLLSPILQQRVQLLSSTSTASESWLPLLCWEIPGAERLLSIVESDSFEPHPVSGEIEFRDIEDITYRRLDEETLQARLKATDLGLIVIYTWCEGDSDDGIDGWRVSELSPSDVNTDNTNYPWRHSIESLHERAKEKLITNATKEVLPIDTELQEDQISDDEDYWAQYDNPAPSTSAQPSASHNSDGGKYSVATSDADYYAQYSQIQPVMDHEDPDEDRTEIGASTLNGSVISEAMAGSRPKEIFDEGIVQSVEAGWRQLDESSIINHPRPSSSSSKGSVSIERLEDSAVAQSLGEIAVQQHISTSIKSLFRLARGVGIETTDFSRIIHTELQTLSIMEIDD